MADAPPAPNPAPSTAGWRWTLRPVFLFGSSRPPSHEDAAGARAEEPPPPATMAATPPPPSPAAAADHHALTLIFDALPPSSLAGPVAATCRSWRDAATAGDAWRARFRPPLPRPMAARLDAGVPAPSPSSPSSPSTPSPPPSWPAAWAGLAATNLLRGASGWAGVATSMRSWMRAGTGADRPPWAVTRHGGQGWAVEFPTPEGAPPPPSPPLPTAAAHPAARPPPFGAIAASFAWCEVVQEVDLVAALVRGRGWAEADAAAWLDAGPTLELSVWVGGRADCPGSLAAAGLVLLDADEVLPPYGSAAVDWAGRGVAAWGSGERTAPAGRWGRLVGRVAAPRVGPPPTVARPTTTTPAADAAPSPGLARPARRALVYLRGRDTAFWAGHYGSKFAGPSLRFVPEGGMGPEEAAEMEEALSVAVVEAAGVGGGFRLPGGGGRQLMVL